MDRKTYLNIWTWFIIIGVSIGLRCLFLQYNVWYDEACSWFTAIQSFPKGILDNLLTLDLQHTPLYFFGLHFWIKMFGDSEVAMRTLSLIFGVVTVPMVYLVAGKLTSKLNATFATAISAVAPLLVFFSVEIRMYPVAVFLVLLSLNYLIDYEQKGDKKSLIKLVFANLLIPYTLVGAIFYNVTLWFCYGVYLFKSNKEKFVSYMKSVGVEFAMLIPYFVLIGYYAKMRSIFVIKHEGEFLFSHIVDLIRNFFGLSPVINVYWPFTEPYNITFMFALAVIVPCAYFIYGYVQGLKNSKEFNKVLYVLFALILLEFTISSYYQINVFTTRYILYVLPPLIILSIKGLANRLSSLHLKIFAVVFFIGGICSNLNYSMIVPVYRMQSFYAIRMIADENKLDNRDLVIMPFGSDAPYYFRDKNAPRVLPFDFHKEVRNPYNKNFYDQAQTESILAGKKGQVIHEKVFSDVGFSDAHFNFFVDNVNKSIEKDRFVLIALFGSDAEALVPIEDLRKSITSVQDAESRCLEILLKKYLFDIRAYLDYDFNLVNAWSKDNYTYLLLKRK